MSEKELAYGSIRDTLFSTFPELLEQLWSTFGSEYDLEKGTPEETPDPYPIFENVVKKLAFQLLESGQNEALLNRLFLFFEDMAKAPDRDVKDLLTIAILGSLVYNQENLRRAWEYMGPKTKESTTREAERQGRQENLPQS
jgi:hypothetical protein